MSTQVLIDPVGAIATSELGDAERLAVAYAPIRLRRGFRALLALDCVLRRIALSAREPLPAQLRLAWWREGCAQLPNASGHAVLSALAECWRSDVQVLVGLVDCWEEIAVGEGSLAAAAEALASQRARTLVACAGEPAAAALDAARIWTLVTLADHAPDAGERATMRSAAHLIRPNPLPRALRPLAVLSGLAWRAVAADRPLLIGDRWSPLAAMRLGIFGR